ncbi:MAG: hypothetical protein P794_03835 [Epsilonproteobacteria bacterium (ex Lamellibrachia satsuma)]|nr:MAG: hypothetical protein P794_03835 [Epsilonproteobacteria bacterium (ex Lamellibrachia satsuma)]
MNQLNNLLSKTNFSITEHLEMADIMVGLEPDLNYKEWIDLLSKNSDQLYIQSKPKKLHIKIADSIFQLYFITKLNRVDYFKLIELCSSPVKVTLENIQEHTHTELDSYFGVSTNIKALNYANMEHDIFYVEPIEYTHTHSPVNPEKVDLDPISIIEERKDYIYFHIEGICFEAKELVGSFDLYCGDEKITTAANKNEVLKKAKSYLDIINHHKEETQL